MAFQSDTKGKLKISRRRTDQLVVSNQVVTHSCCDLSVIFRGFISHLIGHKTINIPEIFSGVHGFTGKTVKVLVVGISDGDSPLLDVCTVQLSQYSNVMIIITKKLAAKLK